MLAGCGAKVGGGNGGGGGEERRGREGRLEAVVRGATVYNSCHRPRANRPCPQLSQSCLNLTSSRLLDDQVWSADRAKESGLFPSPLTVSRCRSLRAGRRFRAVLSDRVATGSAGAFEGKKGRESALLANSMAAR